jgi:hypothetical protein
MRPEIKVKKALFYMLHSNFVTVFIKIITGTVGGGG